MVKTLAIIYTLTLALTLVAPETEPSTNRKYIQMLEYEEYFKEIVDVLHLDIQFSRSLDNSDLRDGKFAKDLSHLHFQIRTKLDEAKRRELARLRDIAENKNRLFNTSNLKSLKVSQHLNHKNQKTFEIDDLMKLIKQTTDDLAKSDHNRHVEFKKYEMLKALIRKSKLKNNKYNAHKRERVHFPGHRAQFEEVWEKQDHMKKVDFNPRTFFMIHDIDSNGFWDVVEVKALFVNELDKIYNREEPEDMLERAEEMERMRKQVFNTADTNKDNLINYQEFVDLTLRTDYDKDSAWETIIENPPYTPEEFAEFERLHLAETRKARQLHLDEYRAQV